MLLLFTNRYDPSLFTNRYLKWKKKHAKASILAFFLSSLRFQLVFAKECFL